MKYLVSFFIPVFVSIALFSSCNKLDVPPVSIIQDEQVFTSPTGIRSYFAGVYNHMPIEDFKFANSEGYFQFNYIDNINMLTGEGMNKNVPSWADMSTNNGQTGHNIYYDCYFVIRQANYFLQTLPNYASNFTPAQVNNWLGEAYFVRAFTYFELAKRFGGVPVILNVQNYPQETLDQLQLSRNSEQEVYDQIGADCDSAYALMGPTSEERGRANKYVAAGLKSRAMLYAGSIAKYNTRNFTDPQTKKRVQGINASEAVRYFKASYAASLEVEQGGYQLYRNTAATDKVGNYANLFYDVTNNKEVMWTKEYSYQNAEHSFDAFAIPQQESGPKGYSSYLDPTEDFVELFDGLPKNADGTLKTTDDHGNYVYYGVTPTTKQVPYSTFNTVTPAPGAASTIETDVNTPSSNNVISNEYGIFQSAEPRLLATVIVPGSLFKGEYIDIRRGIYTGGISGGIPQFNQNTTSPYANNSNIVPSNSGDGKPDVDISNPSINVPASTTLRTAGLSGVYGNRGSGTISGYFIRKYSDPTKETGSVDIPGSTQPWIEMRYAEIELNRAEAAWELHSLGQADADYMQDAYKMINDIRDRAGATLLNSPADLADVDVIRKERRKELAFENKIYWDMIRWRTFDKDLNNRVWRVINPIYVKANGKYIYDSRLYEGNTRYTFPVKSYYQQIPAAELTTNPKLIQNQ